MENLVLAAIVSKRSATELEPFCIECLTVYFVFGILRISLVFVVLVHR